MNTKLEDYRLSCQKIINKQPLPKRVHTAASCDRHRTVDTDRLSFKEIQNITRTMFKDKEAHDHNTGVITNIKGRMYCLKLGEVGRQKELSHYFYATQYKKRQE